MLGILSKQQREAPCPWDGASRGGSFVHIVSLPAGKQGPRLSRFGDGQVSVKARSLPSSHDQMEEVSSLQKITPRVRRVIMQEEEEEILGTHKFG